MMTLCDTRICQSSHGLPQRIVALPLALDSWSRLDGIRARRERELPEASFGSLLVLEDCARPSCCDGGAQLEWSTAFERCEEPFT